MAHSSWVDSGFYGLQLGVVNDRATNRAQASGLDVVMDRCIKIEHQEAGNFLLEGRRA